MSYIEILTKEENSSEIRCSSLLEVFETLDNYEFYKGEILKIIYNNTDSLIISGLDKDKYCILDKKIYIRDIYYSELPDKLDSNYIYLLINSDETYLVTESEKKLITKTIKVINIKDEKEYYIIPGKKPFTIEDLLEKIESIPTFSVENGILKIK